MGKPLADMVDTDVTIDGVARNAASGATVVMPDDTVVHVEGMESWHGSTDGRQVSASGTLRVKREVRGVAGSWYVLERPSWTVKA
jgi:hypothetical protein